MSGLEIPFEIAEVICGMESVCYGESIGPTGEEYHKLFAYIAEQYPELKKKFSHLDIWQEIQQKENTNG